MTKVSVSVSLIVVLSLVTVAQAAAPPRATTLIAPIGNVVGTTIAFSWTAVPEATGYLLKIGGNLIGYPYLQVWYTAEQAGCPSRKTILPSPGTCTIMLAPPVGAGTYLWSVDTWGAGGSTEGNQLYSFLVKDPVHNWGGAIGQSNLAGSERFNAALDNDAFGNAAWVDNETGLVWSHPELEKSNGIQALFVCQNKQVANRKGFRLPTRDELETLVDLSESNPSLPSGHPFNVHADTLKFWTHTREVLLGNNATFTFIVDFFNGESSTVQQTQLGQTLGVWCVRGPAGR